MKKEMDQLFNKIEYSLDKSIDTLDYSLDFMHKHTKTFINSLAAAGDFVLEQLHELYKRNNHDRMIRKASLPWSLLIPIGYKYFYNNNFYNLPIFEKGMHMIQAKVGGGKSLTTLVLAEMILEASGYASYFTSPVEKPQLSDDEKYWFVHHRVVDMKNYYKDGKKVLAFNTDKYKTIFKDERHLQYNPRLNKGKKYNETFIPEHEDHLLMRHDGMERIYMLSQHKKLDSQDMDSINYMHVVSTKKDIPIERWIDSGDLKYIPVKLKFETYTVDVDFDGTMKRKLVKKYSLPIPYDILARFDTHAERYKHAGLPVDYK